MIRHISAADKTDERISGINFCGNSADIYNSFMDCGSCPATKQSFASVRVKRTFEPNIVLYSYIGDLPETCPGRPPKRKSIRKEISMQELNQIHSLLQTINACKKKLTAKNIFIARPEFVPFLKDWSDAISNAALQLYGVTPRYTAQFLDILGDSIRKNKSLLPAYQVYDEWEKIFLTDYEFLNGLAIRADY